MKILALYSLKGGVGKTASAVNLAYLSSVAGLKTLVWDLDPQGAASFYFRIKPKVKGGGKGLLKDRGQQIVQEQIRGTDFEGLDLMPADFSYRKFDRTLGSVPKPRQQLERLLKPLSEEYERIYLDCPPSISLLSENVFAATDVLVVPTIPTPLSFRTLEQLDRHLHRQKFKTKVLPFLSMVDRRKQMHRREHLFTEDDGYRYRCVDGLLETSIPYASSVERMGIHRAPLPYISSSDAATRAYRKLWQELEDHLGGAGNPEQGRV